MHPNVHSSTIYNSQNMEATQIPIKRWLKKTWFLYTMEYNSAIKKNEITLSATILTDLENIMLTEISQKEKAI